MDRRSHYLDVAFAAFVEHGYHGVSMDDLVAAAGGSKATLYRYFPSKRDLFLAIIDDLAERIPSDDDDDLRALPLAEALADVAGRVAAAALSERAIGLLRLAVGEAGRFPELGQVLFDRGPARSYEVFERFIEARRAAGEIEVDAPTVAAEQFIGGIVGHQQLRMALGISTPTEAEIEDRIRTAVRSFISSYAVGASASAARPD